MLYVNLFLLLKYTLLIILNYIYSFNLDRITQYTYTRKNTDYWSKMKILLLENDFVFTEILIPHLEKNNFLVTVAEDGEKAEELIYTHQYDLLILEVDVPKLSGLELAKKLKKQGFKIPIIFLSSSSCVDNFHLAYSYGANDFIRKPFIFDELIVRINYIKEHFLIDTNKIIDIGENIQFNLLTMSITKNGDVNYLTNKEAQILRYFLLNKNRLISTNELVLNVWGYDAEPSIATIRTYIKNIRKHLQKDSFETIKGSGYILKI